MVKGGHVCWWVRSNLQREKMRCPECNEVRPYDRHVYEMQYNKLNGRVV